MSRRLKIAAIAIALIALLLGVNAILTDRVTRPAQADLARVLRIPGPDLQVREDGPRKAPTIVLLHGFTASMHWWEPAVPPLARENRVIRIDLVGHGGSEKPREGYEMESQAGQVGLALRALGVRRATIAGHSMGGFVAVALAERQPRLVDRLVLIGAPPENRFGKLSFTARLGLVPLIGQALSRTLPDAQVRDGLESAFAEGVVVPERFVQDFRRLTYSSYRSSAGSSQRFLAAKPLDERASAAGVRAMVIFGEHDRVVDPAAADAYRHVPGARIETIRGAGHSPIFERPQETARLILGFKRQRG